MDPHTYFLLIFLFGLCNLVLFGLVAAYVIALGRQQKKLQDLSKHLEELIADINEVFDKQGGRPSTDLLRKAYPLESDMADAADEKKSDDSQPEAGGSATDRGPGGK